jgi:hypothetical protein
MPLTGSPMRAGGSDVTHEVGHWLGLRHTFEGECAEDLDLVDDTPQHKRESLATFENPRPDTCPDKPGEDPVFNFMSYDINRRMFTDGQIKRMVEQWQTYRSPHRGT